MSLIGIGRGVAKTVEGIAEGDGSKIVKGVFKVVKSVIFTLLGKNSDDGNDTDNDFDY